MKRFIFLWSLTLCLFTASCGILNNDELLVIEDLPEAITSYVAENYPNSTITEAEKEAENGLIQIEVELDSGEELIFDESGNFIGLDDD